LVHRRTPLRLEGSPPRLTRWRNTADRLVTVMRGVVGQVLRGGGLELGSLFDLYAECVGDVAQPGEAGGAVPVGFVSLDLLLGHSERVGELLLRPPSGDARLDQHGGQLGECAGGKRRDLTAAKLLVVGNLGPEVIGLSVDGGWDDRRRRGVGTSKPRVA
jgi:hypothetical protein